MFPEIKKYIAIDLKKMQRTVAAAQLSLVQG